MAVPSPLAVRMKRYEAETGVVLPDKTWAVIRLDGKSFHSYTRYLNKPFDHVFMMDMNLLMLKLCSKIEGAVFGYTQSDEISIVVNNLKGVNQQLWFGGKVQKIVSVAASYAGAIWHSLRGSEDNFAVFDARVFALPSEQEVKNYLLWRQMDAQRNAIFLAANSVFSHQELLGKSFSEKRKMLAREGLSWENDYSDREKFGAVAVKVAYPSEVEYTHKQTGEVGRAEVERTSWVIKEAAHSMDFSSPTFRFLLPGEPLCQMSEILSSEPTPA